ncbi:MAG: mandelate racemase/muconate lactonizing enzyme family protein [Acetobacteraceae bacterium]|jgi:L-alanine-DL-glutamate epimerase-like enolase superfamily enzyme
MKIKSIDVKVLKVPLDQPYTAAGRAVGANWHVMAEITTEDGVGGFGYIVALNQMFIGTVAAATRELAPLLVGMSVAEPEAAWRKMSRAGDWVGPGGLLHYAIAPLDIAIWDAFGKTLGQPVSRMLGGARDRLPVYASDGFWYSLSLDELAASARRAFDAGFRAVKLRVGNEKHPDGEVARVRAVRDAVGPSVAIMTDATETWSVDRAIRTGKALQEAGVVWIEDPVSHTNVAGMAQVAAALEVTVATGEHLYQIADFTHLLEARGAGIALIDLGRIGGVTPWRHVASVAHGFGIPVGGHVLPEIHVHLLTAVPNAQVVEYVPRSAALLRAMPEISDGALVVPAGGGFGLELDRDAVRRFTV